MTDLFDHKSKKRMATTSRGESDAPLKRERTVDFVRIGQEQAPTVRHVSLLIDPSRLRRFHLELARRLTTEAGIRVTVMRGHAQRSIPPMIDLLFELERLVCRLPRPRLSDRLDLNEMMLDELSRDEPADLIIDLCGVEGPTPKSRTIRVLFDGMHGESVLIGALVAGRTPTVELADARTGVALARGVSCADNAATISEALEYVLSGVVTLLISTARGCKSFASESSRQPQSTRIRGIVALELKMLAHAVVRRLYQLCCYSPHWRTCWRQVDSADLWRSRTIVGTSWNVIPDPGYRFYADPFPLVHQGQTYLFVEDLDHRLNKAVISVLTFGQHGPIAPPRPVLEEPWHLSYPFVIPYDGQIWMIPESVANRSVALYRADPFPHRWVREATLLSNIEASDATVVRHDGSFWMFAATRDGMGSWSDTLSVFSAPDLRGPWTPHTANPVLIDATGARPAGAMIVQDGKLWRPAQDCTFGYGTGIALAEVVRLDHEGYEQKIHSVIGPDPAWPGRRFHTLNRAGSFEFIDGSAYSPRSRRIAPYLEKWSGRREPPASWTMAG